MKLFNLITTLLIILFSSLSNAQVLLNSEVAFEPTASTYVPGGFEMDSYGNTYVTSNGGGIFYHSNGQQWADGTKIMKHDKDGNLIWINTSSSGYIDDIQVSPSHNLFICGYNDGALYPQSFDSLGTYNSSHNIAMLDSSGNYSWAMKIPGNPFITSLPNGNVAFVCKVGGGVSIGTNIYFGDTLYNDHLNHLLFAEINVQGEVEWIKISHTAIDAPTMSSREIEGLHNDDGKLYLYGYCESWFEFDSISLIFNHFCGTNMNAQDMYIAELDISQRKFTRVKKTTKMRIIDMDFDHEGNMFFMLQNYYNGSCTSEPPNPSFLGHSFTVPELRDAHLLKSSSDFIFQETIDLGGSQNQNSAWIYPGEVMVSGNNVFATFFNSTIGDVYVPDSITSPVNLGYDEQTFIVGFDRDLNYTYHSNFPCYGTSGVVPPTHQLAGSNDYGAYYSYARPLDLPNPNAYDYTINHFKTNANRITGLVYKDFDQNESFDNNDQLITGNVVEITPNPYLVVTHNDGTYEAYVDTGAYYLNIMDIPDYYSQVPSTDTVVFNSVDSIANHDLRLEPIPGGHDVSVDIVPMNQMVVGDTVSHKIIVTNNGTFSENVTVYFSPLAYSVPFSSFGISPNMTPLGNFYTATLTNMIPGAQEEFIVTYGLGGQFLSIIGETSSYEAEVSIPTVDEDSTNNIASMNAVPVAPYDPNIKRVNEPELINVDDIGQYKWFNYTIYFQNEGNAPAINVRIDDEIDEKLILTSLQILDASDEVYATILGREISFHFDSIMLPSLNVDEDGSIGYVSFKLKREENLVIGDSIQNNASIYFDINPAIITNTAITSIVDDADVHEEFKNETQDIVIYPNPASNVVYIENLQKNTKSVVLRDLNGRTCAQKETQGKSSISISTLGLNAGIYLIETGRKVTKLIIK